MLQESHDGLSLAAAHGFCGYIARLLAQLITRKVNTKDFHF